MEDPKIDEERHFRSDEEPQQEVEGHRLVGRSEEAEPDGEGLRRRSGEEPEVQGHRMRAPSEGPQRLR